MYPWPLLVYLLSFPYPMAFCSSRVQVKYSFLLFRKPRVCSGWISSLSRQLPSNEETYLQTKPADLFFIFWHGFSLTVRVPTLNNHFVDDADLLSKHGFWIDPYYYHNSFYNLVATLFLKGYGWANFNNYQSCAYYFSCQISYSYSRVIYSLIKMTKARNNFRPGLFNFVKHNYECVYISLCM